MADFVPTLISREENDFNCTVVVSYSDGEQTLQKTYTQVRITDTDLEQIVRNEIAALTIKQESIKNLTYTPGDPISVEEPTPVVPSPTQEEMDQTAFFAAHRAVLALQTAVSIGYASTDDLDKAKQTAVSLYKPEYLALIK